MRYERLTRRHSEVHAAEDTSPEDLTSKPFHPRFTYPVASHPPSFLYVEVHALADYRRTCVSNLL